MAKAGDPGHFETLQEGLTGCAARVHTRDAIEVRVANIDRLAWNVNSSASLKLRLACSGPNFAGLPCDLSRLIEY